MFPADLWEAWGVREGMQRSDKDYPAWFVV